MRMSPVAWKVACVAAGGLVLGVSSAQIPPETGQSVPTFGVTVVAPFGFCGRIYELPVDLTVPIRPSDADLPRTPSEVPGRNDPHTGRGAVSPAIAGHNPCSTRLPKFERLQPIGNIYATRLNVPSRDFREGFPGVTGRFEWFAIDYSARFWIEKPGKYSFELLSDDGSALYIDERRVVDNDCMHAPRSARGTISLEGGIHDMRAGYFQGPRWHVALVLSVKPPDEQWRIFNTDDFRPPPNPADWKYPNPANLDSTEDPCKLERRPQKKLIQRPSPQQ
jgi:hypothetical protein